MKRRIIIMLITTLVVGAIAQSTMWNIGLVMNDFNEQVLRRQGRRTRTRREDQLKPLLIY